MDFRGEKFPNFSREYRFNNLKYNINNTNWTILKMAIHYQSLSWEFKIS